MLIRLLNWLFAIAPRPAQFRRWALIGIGAFAWALLAFTRRPPQWTVEESQNFVLFTLLGLMVQILPGTIVALVMYIIVWELRTAQDITNERYVRFAYRIAAVLSAVLSSAAAMSLLDNPIPHEFARLLIEYPFRSLFAPEALRSVVAGAAAFWMAHRLAAMYTADVFETGTISQAERFLDQAVFASRRDTVHISNGNVVPEDLHLTPAAIGGPGVVEFGLENAVVVELPGGEAIVYGPQPGGKGRAELPGFARIRRAFDLRSRREQQPIDTRSRDGIPISAEDVQFVFSVYRGPGIPVRPDPAALDPAQPFPYDENALLNLAYGQGANWWAAASTQIRILLSGFIASHTLSEFLARTATPEFDAQFAGEQGIAAPQEVANYPRPPLYQFFERAEISALFQDPLGTFTAQATQAGVTVEWVGVGSWIVPVNTIGERHRQAWQRTRENFQRTTPQALGQVRAMSRLEEIQWLITNIHIDQFRDLRNRGLQDFVIHNRMQGLYRDLIQQALALEGRGILTPAQAAQLRAAQNLL